jgi:hypothetical protein
MKVMRMYLQAVASQCSQSLRLDVDHPFLILQLAFHQNKFAARDQQAFTLETVRSNDDVRDAGFIFHRQEYESLAAH